MKTRKFLHWDGQARGFRSPALEYCMYEFEAWADGGLSGFAVAAVNLPRARFVQDMLLMTETLAQQYWLSQRGSPRDLPLPLRTRSPEERAAQRRRVVAIQQLSRAG